jgi:hypothetical protein
MHHPIVRPAPIHEDENIPRDMLKESQQKGFLLVSSLTF